MRTFLIAAWWVLCAVSAFGQNHFDPEHTRRFAAHLFNTGRYDLAQLEYARLTADLPCSDSTQLYMIKAFRMNNNACEGLARFNDCLANGLTTQRDRAQEWVKLKLLCISDPELDEHVLALTVDTVAKTFLLMNVYLTQARFDAAALQFKTGKQMNAPTFEPYAATFESIDKTRLRSPALAATMSAVVPGSGKVYASRWQDGLVAFALCGSSVYHAYRGYDYRGLRSVRFWLFGSLSAGFYLGNIYGSYHAAKKHNRKKHEQALADVRRLFLNVP